MRPSVGVARLNTGGYLRTPVMREILQAPWIESPRAGRQRRPRDPCAPGGQQ